MSTLNPKLRTVAEIIVASDAKCLASEGAPYKTYDFAKLRLSLTVLMGRGGFRMLLGNALARTQRGAPWLRDVRCESDGTLTGFEAASASVAPADYHETHVDLLTHILVLLISYIGPGMTRMVVLETWPHVAEDDVIFGA